MDKCEEFTPKSDLNYLKERVEVAFQHHCLRIHLETGFMRLKTFKILH